MTRQTGVHKSETEKAKEAYSKQYARVERLEKKAQALRDELTEVDHRLGEARDLLVYARSHPLLDEERIDAGIKGGFKDEELPLKFEDQTMSEAMQDDIGDARARQGWKGFPGKHAGV